MKNIITNFIVAIITSSLILSCSTSKNISKSKNTKIEVNEAFRKVYDATQQALFETRNSEFKLESIDLAFATITTSEIGGAIKLWVISGGYKKTKSNSKKATFIFGENEKVAKSLVEDASIAKFRTYLIGVIKSAKSIKNIDTFGLKEIEVEVEFTITKSAEGSVEIEISPVTPSASVNREKETVHTITLKFKKV